MGKEIIFDKNFDDVLMDANNVYQKHKVTTGESWKACSIGFLHRRLVDELDEYDASEHSYRYLLDVLNLVLMLAKRTRGEEDE